MVTEFDIIPTIIGLLLLVIPAMLAGKLCSRFKISEIIGFVVVGIILGPFAIVGTIPFFERPLVVLDDLMLAFWQIAGIMILFSAGLHFTFHDLRVAGIRALTIGLTGVLVPLLLGYYTLTLLGFEWMVAIIIGATLSATSIAVTVTVLEELKKEKSKEGNILVNAAVIDDVLGLAILSAVVSLVATQTLPSIQDIVFLSAWELGLWFAILIASVYFLPKIIRLTTTKTSSLQSRAKLQATALGSAFGLAAIAANVGLNPIVGAFAAGMGLAGSKVIGQIREFIGRIKIIMAPLFFVIIGAHVNISEIGRIDVMLFIIILAIAVVSKVIGCGLPATFLLKNKNQGFKIGYGMIARGEIAFVTAGIGFASGIITIEIFSSLVLVILATIFIASTLLRQSYQKTHKIFEKS